MSSITLSLREITHEDLTFERNPDSYVVQVNDLEIVYPVEREIQTDEHFEQFKQECLIDVKAQLLFRLKQVAPFIVVYHE